MVHGTKDGLIGLMVPAAPLLKGVAAHEDLRTDYEGSVYTDKSPSV